MGQFEECSLERLSVYKGKIHTGKGGTKHTNFN